MKLAHNVCFMDQKIFNSKYFESCNKVISRKNIKLDFCEYSCKTIIKEKKMHEAFVENWFTNKI